MREVTKMSRAQLRGEITRHRSTLRKIASARLGHLAQTYVGVAREALEYEEKLAK